jgi:hypothetical protein
MVESASSPELSRGDTPTLVVGTYLGVHLLRSGNIIGSDGQSRRATLADVEATGVQPDIRIVEEHNGVQKLSDGTYFDAEHQVYYE